MSVNQALVPTMTSYNTPEGEVLYWPNDIPVQSGYPFWKAFDGDLSTRGASSRDVNGTGRLETGLGYHFTKPVKPTSFQFTWGDGNKSNYTFTIKAQGSNDGENWTDLSEEYTIQMKLTTTDFALTANETYTYLRILYVGYSCPTNIGYPQASEIQFYGDPNPPKPHIKSTGSTEAIRDWLNASLYNKEEIDNLFIQNNQSGLIPYDLTVEGYEPEQMVKLVGQTSGKVYNLCLAALMGEDIMDYSLQEQKTRIKWLDGKPIYQRTFLQDPVFRIPITTDQNVWTQNDDIDASGMESLIGFECKGSNASVFNCIRAYINYSVNPKKIVFQHDRPSNIDLAYITLWYTKTTDQGNS